MDYHVYPSGKQVIKAFTANDFQFFDKNSQVISELSDTSIEVVDRVRINCRIQKNCQNNQTVALSSDKTKTSICPILAALRLVLRARHLSQPDSMPVACYSKKDSLAYITRTRIAVLFRATARAVRPTITKDDKNNILPTHCKFGLASFLMRRENCPITSRNAFVGWAIPLGCTCMIRTSSRTSTARPFEHRSKRSWIYSAHSPLIYFVLAPCPKGLVTRTTWGCTMMTWTKGCYASIHSYLISTVVMEIAFISVLQILP